MRRLFLFLFLNGILLVSRGQSTVSGVFRDHPREEIRLKGFDGFTEFVFSNDTTNDSGEFRLYYPKNYMGMASIEVKGQGELLLIISEDQIALNAGMIQDHDNLRIDNSTENYLFDVYINEQGLRNKKLSGWKWLKPIYANETIDSSATLEYITNEIQSLEREEAMFLSSLPKDSYVSYYLPLRKLIEDRPASVNRYVDRVPKHIEDFMGYELGDDRLWTSGLMREFYNGHFVMLENVFSVNDSAYEYMNRSVDHIVEQLNPDHEQLLVVTEYLFKLFEERSLFQAAEYLSIKMLTHNSCSVDGELERRFEQYRKMKEGKIAPNISFDEKEGIIRLGFEQQENDLRSIESKYKLIIFWASWCDYCGRELARLNSMYPSLMEHDIAVIGISLDTSEKDYLLASKDYPWYNYCDLSEWEGDAVQDYHVFATPSFYILDERDTIIKKLKSIAQLEAVLPLLVE